MIPPLISCQHGLITLLLFFSIRRSWNFPKAVAIKEVSVSCSHKQRKIALKKGWPVEDSRSMVTVQGQQGAVALREKPVHLALEATLSKHSVGRAFV